MNRQVFFISDGTGITAESMGQSLLTQFEHLKFDTQTIPYVNTLDKAEQAIERINQTYQLTAEQPLIFSTIINPEIRAKVATSQGLIFDFFDTFIKPLESHLHTQSSERVGKAHGVGDYDVYKARIDAVNYALSCDDGINHQDYQRAEVILIGVSRCGKTPTSLYLALQFGIYVANYPFTEEDMKDLCLPKFLYQQKSKLFGLTIDPVRLHLIRQERRANSHYAAFKTCEYEVASVEKLYERECIPYLNTSDCSIEEIATSILEMMSLKRKQF